MLSNKMTLSILSTLYLSERFVSITFLGCHSGGGQWYFIAMLTDLNGVLSRTSGLDICVWVICLLSFFGQLCSGELLPPTKNWEKFDPCCHATFSHIAESTAQNGACNHHLLWLKTQKVCGDDVWIPCQEAPLDPIHTIHKHCIKNKLQMHQEDVILVLGFLLVFTYFQVFGYLDTWIPGNLETHHNKHLFWVLLLRFLEVP